jgi:hypothetical protein
MNRSAGRLARWAAALLLAWAPAVPIPAAPVPAAPPALTNEDIVRLVVHGTAEPVILREIAARMPRFDLDAGVVLELQRVGVSDTIIAAMRARQTAAGGPGGAPVPAPTGGGVAPSRPVRTGQVFIRFQLPAKAGEDPGPFAIASLPKQVTRPVDGEVGFVSDLSIAVFCTSSIHVPDHWDSKTPLKGAPRHELLLFRPGSRPVRDHGFDLVALDRAPLDPITLEAGRHALVVGLAGKHGSGDWQLIASDPESIEVPADGAVRLLLDASTKIRGNKMVGFQVEQVFTLSVDPMAVQPAPEPPTDPAPTPDAAPPENRASRPGMGGS